MKPDVGEDLPPWLEIALREKGTKEFPGSESNPEILKYYKATTLGGRAEDSATPWCSAFLNWVMEQAGYRGTRRANARSWLDWGEKLDSPRVGCVVILWRGDSRAATGHVTFFTAGTPYKFVGYGGNQGNQVGYAEYGNGRVLGYRWPRDLDRLQPLAAPRL